MVQYFAALGSARESVGDRCPLLTSLPDSSLYSGKIKKVKKRLQKTGAILAQIQVSGQDPRWSYSPPSYTAILQASPASLVLSFYTSSAGLFQTER